MRRIVASLTLLLFSAGVSVAESIEYDAAIDCWNCERWNAPQQPFRIYGNTYYVGVAGLSSILIDSGDGLILLDGGLPQSAALIITNINELGFSIEDVRLIALSHAHYDHAGGIAALQRLSNAKVMTSAAGAAALRIGNLLPEDPQFGQGAKNNAFPAVANVNAIADGVAMTTGDIAVRAVHTPGHTPGGITWTWRACEEGRCLNIVYADSLTAVSAPDYRYFDDTPDNAGSVLRHSIERVASIDCDIFISTHPEFFNMRQKSTSVGDENPFIDANGCRNYADAALKQLDRRLKSEQSGDQEP